MPSPVSDDLSTSGVIGLSHRAAQLLHLHAQGIAGPPRRRARKSDVVTAIASMGVLQIDTISVVARSPYMVLYSRLGPYRNAWLDEALEDGAIAECWAHEACFVPSEDYDFHRDYRPRRTDHWAHRNARRVQDEAGEEMRALLERVRTHGPVRATDFGREAAAGTGWWGWKPEKRWLEAWFALGELMVTRRDRFQRVYDLASRVRSGWPHPPATLTLDHAAVRRHFILCSVKALGIARARWIADYYRLRPRVLDAELEPLIAEGMLIRVRVAGWDADAYVHRDHASLLSHASRNELRATRTVLLSPFDPVVWDRARARELFGFEYTIECYTPAAKRKYGYYVLPILRRGRLIGRLDAKAHRREGRFQVLGVWLEAGVSPTRALVDDVAEALRQCALWHDTPEVVIDRGQPERLAAMLRMALAG